MLMCRTAIRGVVKSASILALTFTFVSCSQSGACTAIDFDSWVRVQAMGGWRVEEVCLDERCVQHPSLVPLTSDEAADYAYRLTISGPDGTTFQQFGTLRAASYWVNGVGCPPRTANATIQIDDSGRVTIDRLRGPLGR